MRTALLVIGYNRPEATARLLEALSADEDGLDRVEIHHYLDGGPGADQDGVVGVIEASEVPYSGLVCRPENYGIGRHLIGARRDLFEVKGYDRVLLIEDDVLPGPRFISTTLALADWAERYDDVGTVQVWNHTTLSEPDLIDSMDVVVPTNGHFFTYCMGKRVWNRIQSILTYYEEVYLRDVAYAKKDWRGIRKHLIKPIAKRPRAMIRGTTLDLRGAEIPHPSQRRACRGSYRPVRMASRPLRCGRWATPVWRPSPHVAATSARPVRTSFHATTSDGGSTSKPDSSGRAIPHPDSPWAWIRHRAPILTGSIAES